MVQLRMILRELLDRLRGGRAAAFLPCQSPPPAPAPAGPPFIPRPPQFPQKRPIRLPPLPPVTPATPTILPLMEPANPTYPREQTTWGLDGGWKPTTSGFETRIFEPPRQTPKVAPQVLAFSIFDGLFDE